VRIRQIALVARDLEPAVASLCDALGLEVCFRDPGVGEFGLHNALMAIGDTFLEVVSPLREGTTAGRLLERRGGDGGYMVILQTDDLARERARMQAVGARVVWQIALEDIASIHLHPKDVGGAIVSLDRPVPPEAWRWGGPDWPSMRPSAVAARIVGAELQSDEPARLAARWAEVLGLGCKRLSEDSYGIDLEGSELRFERARDARGEGLAGLLVKAVAGQPKRELSICGMRIQLV
jgi:catechol 2,3-dioxygenase-like lactoylglutathione lyase family enzyme